MIGARPACHALVLVAAVLAGCAEIGGSEPALDIAAAATGRAAVGRLVGANCMATLVHDQKTLVTAAHCVPWAHTFEVQYEEEGEPRRRLYSVVDARVHPEYERTGGDCFDFDGQPITCRNDWEHIVGVLHSDIAVLTLGEDVTEVDPLPLPADWEAPQEGDTLLHYGRPENSDVEQNARQAVEVDFTGPGWYAFLGDGDSNCVGDSGGSSQPEEPEEAEEAGAGHCSGRPAIGTSYAGGTVKPTFAGVHSSGWCGFWGVDIDAAYHSEWILPCEQRVERRDCESSSSCTWLGGGSCVPSEPVEPL